MRVFVIDDEEQILQETTELMREASEGAEIRSFHRALAALNAIREGDRPDVVFSDIEMPGISGLEFAVRLKEISPETRIVFTTGYEQYAVEAFRIKAHGYLMKPLTIQALRDELDYVPEIPGQLMDKLVVRCFGYFDVYWQGKPVIFSRRQSKELLAYLIDRRGAACSANEIALALWETEGTEKAEHNRLRVLLSDLRSTLKKIGMEEALIREHRELAVRTDMIDCDYYRMLEGDMDALNAYHGEYMKEYSWAEITNARLEFQSKKQRIESLRNGSV